MTNYKCNTDMRAERSAGCSAWIPGSDVLDDEQLFARLDQTEFAAGELFDGVRILTQTAPLFAEPRIVGTHIRQRLFEGSVPCADLHHRQQSLVADQRVNHQGDPDEQQEIPQGAVGERAGPARGRLSGRGSLIHSAV